MALRRRWTNLRVFTAWPGSGPEDRPSGLESGTGQRLRGGAWGTLSLCLHGGRPVHG